MSASLRASKKIDVMNRAADEVGDDYISVAAMAAVIDAEYAPLIKTARDALVEMSWALHNKCVDAPGLFEQRRDALRSALAHIEGDATP